MGTPRPQELTVENNIINVLETSIVDMIAVNSGTCTGNFQTNSLSANTANITTSITVGHILANSGTLTGKATADTFQANNGVYLTSLTVSGIPVRIDSSGAVPGISAVVQDTAPVLGGNLTGNNKQITGLNWITATSGTFVSSVRADQLVANSGTCTGRMHADYFVANSGTFSGKVVGNIFEANTGSFGVSISGPTISVNTASIAVSATIGSFSANSGSVAGQITADTFSGNTGTYNTSLTVSGLPVVIKEDPLRLTFVDGAGAVWTNMPTAATFFNGSVGIVQQADLTKKTQVRFSSTKGGTAGAANSRLFLRYSPTFSATATAYTGMSTTGAFATPTVQVNTTNSFLQTGWETILPAARNVVFLAVVGSGGDATLDPMFGATIAEFR